MVLDVFESLLAAKAFASGDPLYSTPAVPNNLAQVTPNQSPYAIFLPNPHT